MRVRPIVVEDLAWLSPLADRLFSTFEEGYGEAVARWAVDPNVWGWAAEGDEPVGFVLAAGIGLVGDGQPRILDVLAIGVDDSVRRHGVGRRLIARVLEQARVDAGVREVRCTVAADNSAPEGREGNSAARALFTQAGFVVDKEDDGTFPGGQRAVRLVWRPKNR